MLLQQTALELNPFITIKMLLQQIALEPNPFPPTIKMLFQQIALEVHAPDVIKKNKTDSERLHYVQDLYDVLRGIEVS